MRFTEAARDLCRRAGAVIGHAAYGAAVTGAVAGLSVALLGPAGTSALSAATIFGAISAGICGIARLSSAKSGLAARYVMTGTAAGASGGFLCMVASGTIGCVALAVLKPHILETDPLAPGGANAIDSGNLQGIRQRLLTRVSKAYSRFTL